jgi:hypothetical protein
VREDHDVALGGETAKFLLDFVELGHGLSIRRRPIGPVAQRPPASSPIIAAGGRRRLT